MYITSYYCSAHITNCNRKHDMHWIHFSASYSSVPIVIIEYGCTALLNGQREGNGHSSGKKIHPHSDPSLYCTYLYKHVTFTVNWLCTVRPLLSPIHQHYRCDYMNTHRIVTISSTNYSDLMEGFLQHI
jgi:hypothetical protein